MSLLRGLFPHAFPFVDHAVAEQDGETREDENGDTGGDGDFLNTGTEPVALRGLEDDIKLHLKFIRDANEALRRQGTEPVALGFVLGTHFGRGALVAQKRRKRHETLHTVRIRWEVGEKHIVPLTPS